ncbi:hypothetical protein CANTEDRAFT_114117 [Yamadazyma tenuis ATCC 10573]|uniref:GOLD domain-containing protein n=2 Tax=Candida tenuis TaxID=2315449 RepID=G3B352_CANTC|nr:uncharacterized protein CANTEDRAFT_114117 [Yamadazyma tenuis ATCC 10573]EGV64081.1 hypothetical protein CANTEDRAFT_114117 [Yamadazyma tenuis ATCC 10573]
MNSLVKLVATVLLFVQTAQALHFHLNTGESRCFFEELPKDTLVMAKIEALEYNEHSNDYIHNPDVKIEYTVFETFDNDHKVVNHKVSAKGEVPFTSLDAGEHKFCVKPVYYDGTANKKHRIFFDIALGSAHDYVDSKSTNQVDQLTLKVKNLNSKLEKINFEQESIREREAVFRNQSELTNSRVVTWTFIQIAVLVGTCMYQLKHLKSFFVKQKIV